MKAVIVFIIAFIVTMIFSFAFYKSDLLHLISIIKRMIIRKKVK